MLSYCLCDTEMSCFLPKIESCSPITSSAAQTFLSYRISLTNWTFTGDACPTPNSVMKMSFKLRLCSLFIQTHFWGLGSLVISFLNWTVLRLIFLIRYFCGWFDTHHTHTHTSGIGLVHFVPVIFLMYIHIICHKYGLDKYNLRIAIVTIFMFVTCNNYIHWHNIDKCVEPIMLIYIYCCITNFYNIYLPFYFL